MNRVFAPLAVLTLLGMSLTLMIGIGLRSVDIRDPTDADAQRWARIHRLAGVAVGVMVVLVESIVVTYFIGTGRWCREVVEAYRLDTALIARVTRLKRRTFPLALAGMLAIVGVVALGGASDPAAALKLHPPQDVSWTQIHLVASCACLCFIAIAMLFQWQHVVEQQTLIGEILGHVERRRSQRASVDT